MQNVTLAANTRNMNVTWTQRHDFVFMYVKKMKNRASRPPST
jgi:hypothetical protein